MNILGLGEKERAWLATLLARGRQTVRADDFVAAFGLSKAAANLIVSRLARKGWLQRLRPGVYGFVPLFATSSTPPAIEDPLALAAELFAPCYIAGWTAAEHWNFTEQVFNSVAVCTTQPIRQRVLTAAGVTYQFHRLSPTQLFGTETFWRQGGAVLISDPHRTVVDLLNTPSLAPGGLLTMEIVRAYWTSAHADPSRVLDYAARLGNGAVCKRLGFTAERWAKPTSAWLASCAQHVTRGVSQLDPNGPAQGKIVSKWNLRINLRWE